VPFYVCEGRLARYHGRTDMNEFLKMDIFFVVTTVAVVVITILLVLVVIRVLRILKNVEDISVMVEEEGEKIRQDIADVRENVRTEGVKAKHLLSFLGMGKKIRRSKGKS
jgi:cell division protein FtsL